MSPALAERRPVRPTVTRKHSSKSKVSSAFNHRPATAAFNFEEIEREDARFREARQVYRVPRPGSRPSISRESSYKNSRAVIDRTLAKPVRSREDSTQRFQDLADVDLGPIGDRIRVLDTSDDEWKTASDTSSDHFADVQSYSPEDESLLAVCARVKKAFADCLAACAGRQGCNVEMRHIISAMDDSSFRFSVWTEEIDLNKLNDLEQHHDDRQHALEKRALRNICRSLHASQNIIGRTKGSLESITMPSERQLRLQSESSDTDEDICDPEDSPVLQLKQSLHSIETNLRTLRRLTRYLESRYSEQTATIADHVNELKGFFGTRELAGMLYRSGLPPKAALEEARARVTAGVKL